MKRYTSALLIVMILWAIIGFLFTRTYVRLELYGAIVASIVMVVVIIQIERQIILGSKKFSAAAFRVVIGLVMAILGSVIIDQIIFQDDIEKQKLLTIETEVDALLPQRNKEVNKQLAQIDMLIQNKEVEREELIFDLSKNPTISMPTHTTRRIPRTRVETVLNNGVETSVQKDTTVIEYTFTNSEIPNPKGNLLGPLDQQIQSLREEKNQLSDKLINIRTTVRDELSAKKGFLDELEVMFEIVLSSWVSGGIWFIWFLFFFAIEMFVLISKYGDKHSDYDIMIQYQMDVRMKALKVLNEDRANVIET